MSTVREVQIESLEHHFSEFISDVEHGIETVLTRNGVPVARIVPFTVPAAVPPLIAEARRLRASISAGESAAEMIQGARRDAGRT